MSAIECFIESVKKKDIYQYQYLESSLKMLDPEESSTLENILVFFIDNYGGLAELTEAYFQVVDNFREETKYFLQTGKYRSSSYKEVSEIVYFNESYMERYMLGLVLSDYMWIQHINMTRWLKKRLLMTSGKRYLEIGPGFGHYFLSAINSMGFEEYKAVDISPKSVEGTTKFVKHFCENPKAKWSVECRDFFEYDRENFDCIVMGEVLEHVENPEGMLVKIRSLLNPNGVSFVSTVINSPAIDHICLFPTVESVLDMAKRSGFIVDEYMCSTENDVPLDKAIRQKRAITIFMKLLPE